MDQERDGIKRRRRAPRERIPDGEMRNVTFRVGSRAYNMLVEAADVAGKSVSEMGETIIEHSLGDKLHERVKKENVTRHLKSVDDNNLSDDSKRVVETITNALALYDNDGGWESSIIKRLGARFSIQSITLHAMSIPIEDEMKVYADGETPEKIAADKGIHLGSMLWSPLEFIASTGSIRDVLSHPSLKKDYGHLLYNQKEND